MFLFHLNDLTVLCDIGQPNFHHVIKRNAWEMRDIICKEQTYVR